MPVSVIEYVVPGCLMCAKVKDDLLRDYVKSGLISLTICNIGVSRMLPAEISPDMYNYGFLYDETGRAITPTILIMGSDELIFLQKMRFKEFEKAFSEDLRKVMSGA